MSKVALAWQRGVASGLALLLCSIAAGEPNLRDVNYLLLEYDDGSHRLLVFPPEHAGDAVLQKLVVDSDRRNATRLLRSKIARERVRGLLLLSGESDQAALDLAVNLLNDPSDRVREEAEAFITDHPLADESLHTAYRAVEDE